MNQEVFETKILEARKKAEKYLMSKYQLNYPDTQDTLQNALIKAYKNLSSFKDQSSFTTWYIAIAKNEAKTLLAKKNRKKEIEDSNDFLKNYSYSWEEPEVYKIDASQEARDLIEKSINFLSKEHKQVLKLMLNKSLSQKEISLKLKIPVNSVRTRFFYAKKKLRKIISSYAFNSRT